MVDRKDETNTNTNGVPSEVSLSEKLTLDRSPIGVEDDMDSTFTSDYKSCKLMLLFLSSFLLFPATLFPFITQSGKAYAAYEQSDYKRAQQLLEQRLVNAPYDAETNYNLGCVYNKQKSFDAASNCLSRVVDEKSGAESALKNKAYFNWGANCIAEAFDLLPEKWLEKKVDSEVLSKALESTKHAIEKYGNAHALDKTDELSLQEKKKAEKLRALLEHKHQQQEQQDQKKDDQKEDDQKKDDKDNKDEKQDQDDKKHDDQKQSDDEQDQRDGGEQNSQKKQQQDQENSNDQQPNQDDKSDKQDKDDQQKDNKKSDDQQDQTDEQRDQDGQSSEDDKEQQRGDQGNKDDTDDMPAQSSEHGEQAQQAAAAAAQDDGNEGEPESMRVRGMKVMLDKLQENEAHLQKMRIYQRTQGEQPNREQGQNPW